MTPPRTDWQEGDLRFDFSKAMSAVKFDSRERVAPRSKKRVVQELFCQNVQPRIMESGISTMFRDPNWTHGKEQGDY